MVLELEDRKKFLAQYKIVPIPATYFMPYCICPNCHTEALHWIRTPKTEADLDPDRIHGEIARIECHEMYSARPNRCHYMGGARSDAWQRKMTAWENACRRMAVENLLLPESGFDVIRVCRECANSWGQQVANTEELFA
jgi:hypothetical protein